jgi:hypothetical protein
MNFTLNLFFSKISFLCDHVVVTIDVCARPGWHEPNEPINRSEIAVKPSCE